MRIRSERRRVNSSGAACLSRAQRAHGCHRKEGPRRSSDCIRDPRHPWSVSRSHQRFRPNPKRDPKVKHRSPSDLTFRPNGSPMQLNEPPGDAESQTAPPVFPANGTVDLAEFSEDALQLGGRDADPRVRHRNLNQVRRFRGSGFQVPGSWLGSLGRGLYTRNLELGTWNLPGGDGNGTARWGELDGVTYQIHEDLHEPLAVTECRRQALLDPVEQFQLFFFRPRSRRGEDGADHLLNGVFR